MDILCLQEVEVDVFDALRAALAGFGYAGTLAMKGGGRPDGCAAFFRSDRFTLLGDRRLAYSDGEGTADSGSILQLLLLGDGDKRLEIANTHLKWDPPETPRERQLGYRQVLQVIEALRPRTGSPDGQILCGDLNVRCRRSAARGRF